MLVVKHPVKCLVNLYLRLTQNFIVPITYLLGAAERSRNTSNPKITFLIIPQRLLAILAVRPHPKSKKPNGLINNTCCGKLQ